MAEARPTETSVFVSGNPGRDGQRVGTARFLGEDPTLIHEPVWGVIGNLGDSQCYLGVRAKVDAIHDALCRPRPFPRTAGSADRSGIHARRLRRSAQRHVADALLADRS